MAMTITTTEIKIGDRVVFHGTWPWHDYFATVTGEGLGDMFNPKTQVWIVIWEEDKIDPERAGTEGRIGKFVSPNKFHAVKEAK